MYPCKHTVLQTKTGISLIEILIAISIVGILMSFAQESFVSSIRLCSSVSKREDLIAQLSNFLERFSREARMTRRVIQAEDNLFRFDIDSDGDGSSSGSESNIRYWINDEALRRRQGGSGNPDVALIKDIESLNFDYVLEDGTVITGTVPGAQESDVRVVLITVTAAKDTETLSLASAVFLENM
jgi:prepilin-type N-terminal cleavage/methylation domain-containing protein